MPPIEKLLLTPQVSVPSLEGIIKLNTSPFKGESMKTYLPTNDLLFKKTFTSSGSEAILQGLVQNLTRKEREMIEILDRQRATSDAVLSTAKRIGREEGKEELAQKSARTMKQDGLPDELISKYIGYPLEQVKAWLVRESE